MNEKKIFILIAIDIALLIAIFSVFFASGDPDGLESTALVVQGDKTLTGPAPENTEIRENTTGKFVYEPPFPDYTLGESGGYVGEMLVMILGTLLAFFGVFTVLQLIARPKNKDT